ncbi:MAG: TIGR04013 family B12-binding domain/radical SAM domain-containing protein [Chloroflexi bacterium]|nr:TIGR04013 family B12-binding domain/radical SAM domain-containing protein [Chloroflexota bacterium]MBU1749098.1 TIGR04013 family B12-binding domain/radical SAM domain-containing protein [Chloroflexota bacterium]
MIVGVRTTYNTPTWAALAGALDADPRTRDVPLRLLRPGPGLPGQVTALARAHRPVVVGFSFTSPTVGEVATQVAAIRVAVGGEGVIFVAGGPHATGDPAGTLALGFDVAVRGEGEETFPALVDCLLRGSDLALAHIPGLAYERGGILSVGRPASAVDLDHYLPFSLPRRVFGPIEISRGCPHACHFCQVPGMYRRQMRHRSVDSIVAAVDQAQAAGYYRGYVRLVTADGFAYGSADGRTANPAAIEELLQALRSRFGQLYLGSVPSQVHPLTVTPETVALVRRYCDNDSLAMGAQSGSDRLLQALGRGHTVADVRRAVQLTLGAGLGAYVDMIFGLPGETTADVDASLALIEELAGWGAIVCGHAFMPLPGSRLAGAPPGVVPEEARRLLGQLAQRGLALETWRTQEGYAAEMAAQRLAA